eukprot:TRINITY_DN1677_c0_g1_i1.p1 TRINITY_DN1677_c0_g1~~TRINITY_DN1677_c0_g1_i1.p1  ORF type:complete len:178 (+),score=25.58 TRINITY_DN1677_c0_g1_i1:212-745(+)
MLKDGAWKKMLKRLVNGLESHANNGSQRWHNMTRSQSQRKINKNRTEQNKPALQKSKQVPLRYGNVRFTYHIHHPHLIHHTHHFHHIHYSHHSHHIHHPHHPLIIFIIHSSLSSFSSSLLSHMNPNKNFNKTKRISNLSPAIKLSKQLQYLDSRVGGSHEHFDKFTVASLFKFNLSN